jgi:hypothetical protein
MLRSIVAVLACAAAPTGAAARAAPIVLARAGDEDARSYELDVLKPVFEKYYQAGSDYYRNGWRNEALWCFERATKLLPEFGGLQRFVGLLRDFDNPVWKKKRWKSPRAAVDASFLRKKESFDLDYVRALLKIGVRHGRAQKDASLQARAQASFRSALEIVGGPYEIDAAGCIVAGEAGVIPESFSRRMAVEDLVLINGKRWLRDSMLRQLKDVSEVHEARDGRRVVRTLTSQEEAARLLALVAQADAAFGSAFGERRTRRPLGLFVFADRKSYEEWCKASGNEVRTKAAGFANCAEGFAVTFAQKGIEPVAVHEAAHLYHFDVYAAAMPSWYEEGLADSFGGQSSMRLDDGKLVTGIKPTKAALASLLRDGRLAISLPSLLRGDSTALIAADDGSAPTFYLASWALYCFLTTTKEPRLSARFEDWESFSLGSRWSRDSKSGGTGGGGEGSATELFDRLFRDLEPLLESAFTEWVADPQ